jgi:hypothetical protein
MIDNGWTETNCRERHLRRNGKIVGKLAKSNFLGDCGWSCYIYNPRLQWIGYLKNEGACRQLTESRLLGLENISK